MNKFYFVLCCLAFALSNCKNETPKNDKPEVQVFPPQVMYAREYIHQHPDDKTARWNLINLYDSLAAYPEAIAQIDSLIAQDNGSAPLWYKRGTLLQNKGDTLKAIQSFTNAIRVYPSIKGLLALANLYAETKNPITIKICNRICKFEQGAIADSYAYFFMGVYYARIGDTQKALEWFNKCITKNYTLMDAHLEKGYLYYDSKDYNMALKIFATAAKINIRYALAYYWMAKCEVALHQKMAAIEHYEMALSIDKNLKEAHIAIDKLKSNS